MDTQRGDSCLDQDVVEWIDFTTSLPAFPIRLSLARTLELSREAALFRGASHSQLHLNTFKFM